MNKRMGPRYILKDAYQIKELEINYQQHLKRLENIKNADNHKKSEKADDELERLKQVKINNLRFMSGERLNEIDRENQILLERLIHISKTPNQELLPSKAEAALGKMLHLSYRKKQQERITSDNVLFAQRLMSQRAMFESKKHEDEFEKHHKLMRQMQKLGGSVQKLPPIEIKKREMNFNLSIDLNPAYIGQKMHPIVSATPKGNIEASKQDSILVRRNRSIADISTNRSPISYASSGRGSSLTVKNLSYKNESKQAKEVKTDEKKTQNQQAEQVKPKEQAELVKPKEKAEQVKPREQPEQVQPKEQAEQVQPKEQAEQVKPKEQPGQVEPKEQPEQVQPKEQAEQVQPKEQAEKINSKQQIETAVNQNEGASNKEAVQDKTTQEKNEIKETLASNGNVTVEQNVANSQNQITEKKQENDPVDEEIVDESSHNN